MIQYFSKQRQFQIFLLFFLILNSCIKKVEFSESKIERIDTLMEPYRGDRPGYALGIVEKGKLVYSKGFGQSNLDYNIPISENSAFYIGSMAKQFTAAALLILEAEGKIDLDAPVKSYLSEFPDYEDKITVNHLIHHTSGIRETNSLQLFQGINRNFEEVFNTQDLIQLIYSQRELNFKPGEEYRYSSGGYAILAKIVERISQLSFREFLENRIFKPLDMKNTLVYDNHNEIVPNRVVSYWPIANNKFERRNQIFDAYGDGGIITTVNDLAKWDRAFYEDLLGVKCFSDKMYQKTALNSGDTINYARALNVWKYKGEKVVQHNGGMLGFRVDMLRFPDHGTSIILLGNSAFLDPTGESLKIAEIVLPNSFKTPESIENSSPSEVQASHEILKELPGHYWTDQTNYWRRISKKNDSLFIDSGSLENKIHLIPISKDELIVQNSNPTTRIVMNSGESITMYFGKTKRKFRKFNPNVPSNLNQLENYIGTYTSEELSSNYRIFKQENKLFLSINNSSAFQIFPKLPNSDVIWNGSKMLWIGFGEIKFEFDKSNFVTGLIVGDNRVSGVRLEKISSNQQ